MHILPRLAARLYKRPLLLLPETAETLAMALGARLSGLGPASKAYLEGEEIDLAGLEPADPYTVTDGVATIPLHGELVNRGAWLTSRSGLTSYDAIRSALRAAAADPRVEKVVLDIDSPGGEASGAMETAEEVRALSRVKPVTAFVNSLAASAAYAVASGAKEIVAMPSATLGSIGVVWLHLDHSGMMAEAGIKPTLLYAGARKIYGNQLAPLDDAARDDIQSDIDAVYDLFTETVGKMRPKLGQAGARATEAGIYRGKQAVAAGLADRIGQSPFAAARIPSPQAKPALAEMIGDLMAVHLNGSGNSHANSLIASGKVDKESGWSFSAEDGNKLLGPEGDDWANYGKFHLGADSEAEPDSKGHWKYPYGKDGKVYRSGVIAAKSRAAQQGAKDIENAAARLLVKIDGKEEKEEKEAAMADALAIEAAKGIGAAEERGRIKSILDSEHAVGRPKLARHLALATSLDLGAAEAMLAAAAAETSPAPTASRMAQVPVPKIAPDSAQREHNDEAATDALWKGIATNLNATLPKR